MLTQKEGRNMQFASSIKKGKGRGAVGIGGTIEIDPPHGTPRTMNHDESDQS